MSLLYDSMVDCIHINQTKTSDGIGGSAIAYSDGTSFKAAIVFNSSSEVKTAMQDRTKSAYRITVPASVALDYHDIIKRKSDNKIFRITSNSDDMKTPKRASFQVRAYDAEEWRLDYGNN